MSDARIKIRVLSGSPELLARIPKTPPKGIFPPGAGAEKINSQTSFHATHEEQFAPSATKTGASRGKMPGKRIAICLAAVVIVGAGVALALNGGKVTDETEAPGAAASMAAQPQSPGGLSSLLGGGGGDDSALYQGSYIGTENRVVFIDGTLHWQTMRSMYRLDGTEMVEIRHENSAPVLEGILCIGGDLYYRGNSDEYTLMRAPGGDFAKEEGIYSETYSKIYTDGLSIFLGDGQDIFRLDCKSLEVTPVSNVMSAQAVMAHDGMLYGNKNGLWCAQDYQGGGYTEISSPAALDALAAGAEGVVAISREGGLYRIASGAAEQLISAEEIFSRIGAEGKLDSSGFTLDGKCLYFAAEFSGTDAGDLPKIYRYHTESGSLQGIHTPTSGFNDRFTALNGWMAIGDNLYKLEEKQITGSVLLSQEHDSRGVRQDMLVYEKTEIALIDF